MWIIALIGFAAATPPTVDVGTIGANTITTLNRTLDDRNDDRSDDDSSSDQDREHSQRGRGHKAGKSRGRGHVEHGRGHGYGHHDCDDNEVTTQETTRRDRTDRPERTDSPAPTERTPDQGDVEVTTPSDKQRSGTTMRRPRR